MAAWSNGYVADIPYTYGFFRRMTPAHLRFTAITQGFRAPSADQLAYAELGCGQGFGTAMIAASNPGATVFGFDFNPEQIANARRLAERAGLANLTFGEISFEELAAQPRGALPDFDVVALHGIYSWVSPQARAAVRAFIRTKLKPGGLVYISYNAMPGCAAIQPFQRLLRDEAARASGTSDVRAEAALAAVQALADKDMQFFKDQPAVLRRLETHRGQAPAYLAHEYLNGDWETFYVADVAAQMAEAKLSFVGSARLVDNDHRLAVSPEMATFLDGIDDPIRRETLKDYWANRPFRMDVFQKGRLRLDRAEARSALRAERVGLRVPPEKVKLSFPTGAGRVEGRLELFGPILERLAAGPASIGELEAAMSGEAKPALLLPMLLLLDSADQICAAPARPGDPGPALRLNQALGESWTGPYRFVAAPALGSGLEAAPDDLLLLAAVLAGAAPTVEGLADAVRARLASEGRTLAPATGEEGLEAGELVRRGALRFVRDVLPLWRAAGVIGPAAAAESAPARIAAVS